MKTITYGAEGLMDWQAEIQLGKAKLNVTFSGGTMTKYGVTPAEYTTSNEFVQKAIENSTYFKTGRIKIVRCIDTSATTETTSEEEAPNATAKVNIIIPDNATEVKVKKIEVSCLPEAQEYLRDNFGISTSAVTSKAKAQDYAKQYGIQFHFVKL